MTAFKEIQDNREEYMNILRETNPELARRIVMLESQLESQEELHRKISTEASADNVRTTRQALQEAFNIADSFIASAPVNRNDEFADYNLSELAISEKTQSDCLAIATQIANRVTSPAQIAFNTGLPLFRILSLLKNGEFQQKIEEFDRQLSPDDSAEAKTLKSLERNLKILQMERAVYATTQKELTDGEMVALGFNPRMRDVELAMTPGGKTGYVKMVPITTRKSIGNKSRMVTEMVPELDAEMIRLEMQIAERLTQLEEAGKSGATRTINTYVKRKDD